MLLRTKPFHSYKIRAGDDEIGKVHDLFFDDETFTVRYLVADTGGWLTNRRVLLSPISIDRLDHNEMSVDIGLTKQQIEHSPGVDSAAPVSRQHEMEMAKYYDWPPYWGELSMQSSPQSIAAAAGVANESDTEQDPHLRSVAEVTGYHIHATDGQIGHVEELIVDDTHWQICYVVVDTRNWWPGGDKVIISPQWVVRVEWVLRAMHVGLTVDAIKSSPKYDEQTLIERDYEQQLFNHYQRRGYWE